MSDALQLSVLARKPSAWLPIVLSLSCLAMLLGYVVFGTADHPPPGQRSDEGVAAHLFQLLMLAQTLIAVFFAIRWLPRAPNPAGIILAVQIAVAALPVVLVWFFEHGAQQ